MQASEEQYSFYPQIAFFANHPKDFVKTDSLDSVKTETFIVGEGTSENPYLIRNESDWLVLADSTNNGNDYQNKYFIVSNELSELNFYDSEDNYIIVPVGTNTNPFNGIIDGQGIDVRVSLNRSSDYQGLFGAVGEQGEVRNFSVSGSIKGAKYTAGIAGINRGLIEQVYNRANITGTNFIAGIAGLNEGVIRNVYNRGKIVGNTYVGGITGFLNGNLNNSYNSGIIYGRERVGALVGFYEVGQFNNNYYDRTVLVAYRDVGTNLKPEGAVGSSYNGDFVKGLDQRFMTGQSVIGVGTNNIVFTDYQGIWTTNYNIDGDNNYPQLEVFSRNPRPEIKESSFESTKFKLYTVMFDENNETESTFNFSYVIYNEHYQLYVPEYFGYNFLGWFYNNGTTEIQLTNKRGESLSVYGFENNLEVYARWEEAYHLVKFVNGNNQTLFEETIRHGEFITKPEGLIPEKRPDNLYVYRFLRWDFDFANTMILKPTIIRGEYESIDRYYDIVYYNGDDDVFAIRKAEYETYINPISSIPTKTYHDEIAYKFVEWDFNFNQVIKEDYEIYPIFIEVPRYYQVRFYNGDYLMVTRTAEYLASVEPPLELPIRERTAQYVYQFSGWSEDITSITNNLDVYAEYDSNLRKYTVNFLDGNNAVFDSQQIEYGSSASTPATKPTKDYYLNTAYKFVGWIEDYSNIIKNTVIHADFVEVPRYYDVLFYDVLDNVIETQVVEYLKSAEAPNVVLTKEPTEKYIYTFTGWDQDFSAVEKNMDIKPVFIESLRPYNVTFLDGNGDVFDVQEVLYGKDAEIPVGRPPKAGQGDIGYKFTSWNNNYKKILEDTIVTPNYTEVARWYIVTFVDGATILKSEQVEYGASATAPEIDFDTHPTVGWEYYFVSWSRDFSFIEADLTVSLNKGARLKRFLITIINGDSTTTQIVEWGKNVVFPTPYKTGNKQLTYRFVGWDDDGRNIREERTITALFEADYSYFEVRFYDYYGDILKISTVTPGSDADEPEFVPSIKLEYTVLAFVRWDKDFTEVEENLNVYAKYQEVDRYYEVTFYDAFNEIIEIQTIEYGKQAHVPAAPLKEISGRYYYVFKKWSEDVSFIASNLNVYPLYDEFVKTYSVNFYDGDINLISKQIVEYGLNAIAPTDVKKTPTETIYYLFVGWDKAFTNVKEDLDVYAEFGEVDRWYTVSFIGKDQELLDQQIIEYGSAAIDPRAKLEFTIIDDETVYAIVGWDKEFNNITTNLEVYAIYDCVDRYYDVVFYNYDGIVHAIYQKVEYGTNLEAPLDPTRDDEADYFYVFAGWDEDFSFITENLHIYPNYLKIKKYYTVKFYDGDDNLFDEQIVEYDNDAVSPGIPPKQPTDEVMFIFTGWDKEFNNVKEDLVIKPEYSTHIRTFTVIFIDEHDNTLKTEEVRRGANATPPTNISEKPSDEYFDYVIRWDKDYTNITEDTITQLYYEAVDRIYKATFYYYDETVYQIVTGTYQQIITAPESPERPMDEKYLYEFVGWHPEFIEVITEDVDYYPVYDKELRYYTVTFLDGDDEIYEEQLVSYGNTPTKPVGIPIKTETQQYYYVFRMWETTTIKIYQDLTIKALFYSNLQEYEVTFIDEFGNVIERQNVEYGVGAVEPDTDKIPVKPSTHQYVYAFAGWDKNFSYITEDLVVQTVYLGTLRKFTYTFYHEDETTILKQIIGTYGSRIIPPDPPTKVPLESESYIFLGWDKPVPDMLTEDVIFVARFASAPRTYTVLFLDGDGLILEAQLVNFGEAANEPAQIPSKEPTIALQYVFAGWLEDFSYVTSDLTVHPTFNEEPRIYQVRFMVNGVLYETLEVPYLGNAEELIATPQVAGYTFIDWDKDVSKILGETTTSAILRANKYYINFYNGYEVGDVVEVEGIMTRMTVDFNSIVKLNPVEYTRKGFMFVGWKNNDNGGQLMPDQHQFVLKTEGLNLTAIWTPIVYNINYELDGGTAINPENYTVNDHIILQSAYKPDHQFEGWYLQKPIVQGFSLFSSGDETGEKIEEIIPGTIGNITLIARYKYDGFIQLKGESLLGMYYAEIVSTIPIEEREGYDEANPVYLLGVFLGQTIENLRENFVNDDLIFVNKDQEELVEEDIVATGYQILKKDENDHIVDRVYIVLKGDLNGDGIINVLDLNILANHIGKTSELITELQLLASNVKDDDEIINVLDLNLLSNHIGNISSLWDENMDSTLKGE